MESAIDWKEMTVLVTGGTGSFGRAFARTMLEEFHPGKLIIFSRDEAKQDEMRQTGFDDPCMRYFIGDVRDVGRLRRALEGVDIVVHAAALKQVPACEYNPIEAVRTNIDGARNLVDAVLDRGVTRVMGISTDKAVNPVNLYGATKLVAEKLMVQANSYSGVKPSRFSCVRYGNVAGSRGSLIPLLIQQRRRGKVSVTDPRMTRFWLTLEQGVRFTIRCIEQMRGGEVFAPKIPSMSVLDLVACVAPDSEVEYIGIRPGEKINEVLVSEDEARHAVELDDMFVIQPSHPWWETDSWQDGKALPDGFRFASNENSEQVRIEQLKSWVAELE